MLRLWTKKKKTYEDLQAQSSNSSFWALYSFLARSDVFEGDQGKPYYFVLNHQYGDRYCLFEKRLDGSKGGADPLHGPLELVDAFQYLVDLNQYHKIASSKSATNSVKNIPHFSELMPRLGLVLNEEGKVSRTSKEGHILKDGHYDGGLQKRSHADVALRLHATLLSDEARFIPNEAELPVPEPDDFFEKAFTSAKREKFAFSVKDPEIKNFLTGKEFEVLELLEVAKVQFLSDRLEKTPSDILSILMRSPKAIYNEDRHLVGRLEHMKLFEVSLELGLYDFAYDLYRAKTPYNFSGQAEAMSEAVILQNIAPYPQALDYFILQEGGQDSFFKKHLGQDKEERPVTFSASGGDLLCHLVAGVFYMRKGESSASVAEMTHNLLEAGYPAAGYGKNSPLAHLVFGRYTSNIDEIGSLLVRRGGYQPPFYYEGNKVSEGELLKKIADMGNYQLLSEIIDNQWTDLLQPEETAASLLQEMGRKNKSLNLPDDMSGFRNIIQTYLTGSDFEAAEKEIDISKQTALSTLLEQGDRAVLDILQAAEIVDTSFSAFAKATLSERVQEASYSLSMIQEPEKADLCWSFLLAAKNSKKSEIIFNTLSRMRAPFNGTFKEEATRHLLSCVQEGRNSFQEVLPLFEKHHLDVATYSETGLTLGHLLVFHQEFQQNVDEQDFLKKYADLEDAFGRRISDLYEVVTGGSLWEDTPSQIISPKQKPLPTQTKDFL